MSQAFTWCAVSAIFVACGGSQFSSADDANGGGAGQAGSANEGGSLAAGGKSGKGGGSGTAGSGVVPSGGSPDGGTDSGTAGDVAIGGTTPTGGRGGTSSGGVTSGGVTNGGTNSGGIGTGGGVTDPGYISCPAAVPDGIRGCAVDLTCTYGNDLRSSCRTLATCKAHGKWAVGAGSCEPLATCSGVQVGNACDTMTPCALTDSIYCACVACSGPDCKAANEWDCAGANSAGSCPAVLPNEGVTCNADMTCSYGSCGTGTRITAICKGVVWAWSPEVCP